MTPRVICTMCPLRPPRLCAVYRLSPKSLPPSSGQSPKSCLALGGPSPGLLLHLPPQHQIKHGPSTPPEHRVPQPDPSLHGPLFHNSWFHMSASPEGCRPLGESHILLCVGGEFSYRPKWCVNSGRSPKRSPMGFLTGAGSSGDV